jgi:uncharacterized protein YjdB
VTVTAAVLTAIVITPTDPSIAKGTSQQLTATGVLSDLSTQDLTHSVSWTSAATGFAIVNPTGLVTGIAVGNATVTATQGTISGSTPVTVTAAVLTAIVVTPAVPSIAKGTSVQVIATGTFSDGTTQDLTNSVSWTSAPTNVGTVDPNGLLTGTGLGSVSVTATQGTISGSASVTVTAATLASIAVAPTGPTIAKSTAVQLTAIGTFSDGSTQDLTHSVSWTSTATGFATVDPTGLVTGIAVGNATVTATQGTISGSTPVTVTAAVLASIEITPANPILHVNQTENLTAIGIFSDGTRQNLKNTVSWTSSAVAIATVEPSGVVKGLAVGTTTITATQGTVSGTTNVTVIP